MGSQLRTVQCILEVLNLTSFVVGSSPVKPAGTTKPNEFISAVATYPVLDSDMWDRTCGSLNKKT
jgi:hypothetical protein